MIFNNLRKRARLVPLDPSICLLELTWDAKTLNEKIMTTECPFVAFTDVVEESKDSYFTRLMQKLEKHPDVNIVGGVLHDNKPLTLEEDLPEKKSILDAAANSYTGLVYPAGLVCRTQALRDAGVLFDEDLEFYRDEVFSAKLSSACPKRLYVPDRRFRTHRDFPDHSLNTPQSHQPGWYWELVGPALDKLKAFDGKKLKRSTQHTLLYLLIHCFSSNENANVKMVFADITETEKYLDEVRKLLKHIDLPVLFSRRTGTRWPNPKLLYFAKLRNDNEQPELDIRTPEDGKGAGLYCTDGKHRSLVHWYAATPLYVQNLELVENADGSHAFKMFIRFPSSFPTSEFELHLVNRYDGEDHDCQLEETQILSSCTTFFDLKAYDTVLWKVEVPLADSPVDQVISGYGVLQGEQVPLKIMFLNKSMNKLCDDCPEQFWAIPGCLVHAQDSCIKISPATQQDVEQAEKDYCKMLAKGSDDEKFAARIRRRYHRTKKRFEGKRIWVYFDKAFKAGDNAEFLFRYASAQNDGIEHVFYIDPNTADAKRLRKAGYKVMEPRSPKGMVYLLNAEVVFATHVPAWRIPGIKDKWLRYYKDLLTAKNIRLYHGFTLTHDCSYAQPFMDSCGTVVSSRYEHELYADPVHGFAEDQIIDSGMPRHDGVLSENKRWILFAPTWRPTLRGGIGKDGETIYNPDFVKSRYFQRYNTILTDERLLECARRCGYKIKLYLHPRMAPMTVDFKGNDVFEAIDCTQGTEYADIMSKSDLMITDYSSVMVDFGYARKPVIYYQDPALPYWRYFDFDYRNLGFGEVVESTGEVVDLLCEYMENDCQLKDFYRKRIDDFFYHDDQNNSKRLYEAVRKMLG